jgi:hypothetical protein
VTATWATAPTAGNLYCIIGWHDSVNNLIGISVNAGGAVTTAHSTGIYNGTCRFGVGAQAPVTPAYYYDGILKQAFLYRKVLTADNREWMYNGGTPRDYSELGQASIFRSPIFGGVAR